MKTKKAVLLVNLGTPNSPSVKDVRIYLREFLMDRRVIDIPFVSRFLLVNGIIAPFRAPESAKGYQELWTEEGSPLKVMGYRLKELVQEKLDEDEYVVFLAMRYQNPSIRSVLKEIERKGFDELIIFPLYPQYASSSTGSSVDEVLKYVRQWEVIPHVRTINQFPEHPLYIETVADRAQEIMRDGQYDHFIFSYHGLPERHIHKSSCDGYCRLGDCCNSWHSKNQYCYRAQCFLTSRLLVEKLGLSQDQYTVSFQSRLGRDPWVKPYTDEVLKQLAQQGKKKLLVFSPAFVADCLETTVEIGLEYKEEFLKLGGKELDLVPSLNDHPTWIECILDLIKKSPEPSLVGAQ